MVVVTRVIEVRTSTKRNRRGERKMPKLGQELSEPPLVRTRFSIDRV